jgi:hypothetical protein
MKFEIFLLLSILTLAVPETTVSKDWRGVTPLKTTRAEVEKRFGKPDERGGYDFKDQRASFEYGDGSCKGVYLTLGEVSCKCLAADDAVMSIFVEPLVKVKISDLRLDPKKFKKDPINPFPHTFTYSNIEEGIVYTVDESEDELMHITYYPAVSDCQELTARSTTESNSWRGLRPLRSSRKDVEALLGSPKRSGTTIVTYETDYESAVATYSDGKCGASGPGWNVPKNTLVELVVNPTPDFHLKELQLPSARYARNEIFQYPETPNPPRVWIYTDRETGITIRTQADSGGSAEEIVVSITYFPAQRDEKLRCRSRND